MKGIERKFKGELWRVAGGPAYQLAAEYAVEKCGCIASRWNWTCQGVAGCYVVFDTVENARAADPEILITEFDDVRFIKSPKGI